LRSRQRLQARHLERPEHPIRTQVDVVVDGGFGTDGWGLGKFGGIEVLVDQRDGKKCEFLTDVPYAIAGWLNF
jgi:hypothetical protein